MTTDFIATRSVTLHAHYQRITLGRNYTITFVLHGGTMPANVGLTQVHAYGTHINALPVPTRAGHTFVGWLVAGTNNVQHVPFIMRGNLTLNASWATVATPSPTPTPTIPPAHVVAVFDPSPGAFPGNESGVRTGTVGFTVTAMPNPTRTGYTFAGWQIGNTPVTLPLRVQQDVTVTARWTPVGGRVNPPTSPIQVTFAIFGAVMLVGVAGFGIMKLAGKQLADIGQYRSSVTRYNREKRITDLFNGSSSKKK